MQTVKRRASVAGGQRLRHVQIVRSWSKSGVPGLPRDHEATSTHEPPPVTPRIPSSTTLGESGLLGRHYRHMADTWRGRIASGRLSLSTSVWHGEYSTCRRNGCEQAVSLSPSVAGSLTMPGAKRGYAGTEGGRRNGRAHCSGRTLFETLWVRGSETAVLECVIQEVGRL
jgi:hypothetical protein